MDVKSFSIIFAAIFVLAGNAVSKPAGCPCSPCTCSPCSCGGGGGGGKKGDKHHHHHDGDHGGVGVGVSVDLGGVGHRSREADPFAVSGGGGSTNTPHTEEKHKPKSKQDEGTTQNPFTEVQLTGEKAKDETVPSRTDNVSDEVTPPSLPVSDAAPTMDDLDKAKNAFNTAEKKFLDGDADYQAAFKQYKDNVSEAGPENKAGKKAGKAFKKMVARKDAFKTSDDGKKLFDDWMKAYQQLNGKPNIAISDDQVPPDKLEQAKHNVAKAQAAVTKQQDFYNGLKSDAVKNHIGVKSIQTAIDELKKKPHTSEKEAQADRDKLKQLEGDLDNAKKQAGKEFDASDVGKGQMKITQAVEQQLDEAKKAFKPFEGLEPKSASNP